MHLHFQLLCLSMSVYGLYSQLLYLCFLAVVCTHFNFWFAHMSKKKKNSQWNSSFIDSSSTSQKTKQAICLKQSLPACPREKNNFPMKLKFHQYEHSKNRATNLLESEFACTSREKRRKKMCQWNSSFIDSSSSSVNTQKTEQAICQKQSIFLQIA